MQVYQFNVRRGALGDRQREWYHDLAKRFDCVFVYADMPDGIKSWFQTDNDIDARHRAARLLAYMKFKRAYHECLKLEDYEDAQRQTELEYSSRQL